MANKKTLKSSFESPFSPGKYITPAQYITELICKRKAQSEKIDLPLKFWNLPKWLKYYQWQIIECNRLLKNFHYRSIIRALHDKKCEQVFSLRAPWLVDIIIKYERLKDIEVKIDLVPKDDIVVNKASRPGFKPKKTLRERLDEI